MSYFIVVYCKLTHCPSRREIAHFIRDGVYFETTPIFEPSPETEEAEDQNWRSLVVRYQSDKRPVVVNRDVQDSFLQQDIEEVVVEVLDKLPEAQKQESLRNRLQSCQQAIAFDIDPVGLTEDAWVMLDSLEAYLAQYADGIIYAPDDGFYDSQLKLICSLRGKRE